MADTTKTPPVRVLISYRREDTAGHAGRVYDALIDHFGREQVFMDIDAIEPGVDFSEVIAQEVSSCDVLLAVIGRRWLSITDAKGRRRLDNPEDFHRLEIQEALQRNIRVIPVLVQDADMPSVEDLPESIGRLGLRNALDMSDNRWRYDVGRLISAIEGVARTKGAGSLPPSPPPTAPTLGPPAPPQPEQAAPARRSSRGLKLVAAGGIAAAMAVGLIVVLTGGGDPRVVGPTSSPSPGSTTAPPSVSPSPSITPSPTPSPSPSPSASAGPHEALRSRVPVDLRSTCTDSDDFLPGGAVAGIECSGSGGNTVWYYSFQVVADIDDWYDERVSGIGATRDQGICAEDDVAEFQLFVGTDETDGRVLCHTDEEGRWIEWTRRDLLTYSYAFRADGAKRRLFNFWRNAGPV